MSAPVPAVVLPALLDWRKHRVGSPLPGYCCGRPAACRNEQGQPWHKVCAEAALRARWAVEALQ